MLVIVVLQLWRDLSCDNSHYCFFVMGGIIGRARLHGLTHWPCFWKPGMGHVTIGGIGHRCCDGVIHRGCVCSSFLHNRKSAVPFVELFCNVWNSGFWRSCFATFPVCSLIQPWVPFCEIGFGGYFMCGGVFLCAHFSRPSPDQFRTNSGPSWGSGPSPDQLRTNPDQLRTFLGFRTFSGPSPDLL